jgi:hypothetical protein
VLNAGVVKRVFVLISDAFRYEAADQLARDINGKSRLTARLDAMLGVLPSYTALGMASAAAAPDAWPTSANASRGRDCVDGQPVVHSWSSAQCTSWRHSTSGVAIKAATRCWLWARTRAASSVQAAQAGGLRLPRPAST